MAENYLEHTIRRGETLQALANDLMDDVYRWQEIAFVNNLQYPYISDAPQYSQEKSVKKTGDSLIIPITSNQTDLLPQSEVAALYRDSLGTDLSVLPEQEASVELTKNDIIEFSDNGRGDLNTVTGGDNLKQSLILRLATPYGTLLGHPTYGSDLQDIIGTRGITDNLHRLQVEIERTIRTDKRIKDVTDMTAYIDVDVARVSMQLEPSDLDVLLDLNLTLNESGDIEWA